MRWKEEISDLEDARERYLECWYEKYGREPIFTDLDSEQLKWCLSQVGRDDVLDAIRHYFTIKDEWFLKKCYSVGVFKDNLNLVLASMHRAEVVEKDGRRKRLSDIELLQLYGVDVGEARKRLHLRGPCDDWMVKPPYSLGNRQFEQWKELVGFDAKDARERVQSFRLSKRAKNGTMS